MIAIKVIKGTRIELKQLVCHYLDKIVDRGSHGYPGRKGVVMDNFAKLMELLQRMSLDELRLLLHFAEFLESQRAPEKTSD